MPYYKLQYFDEVENDIYEAKIWYKQQKNGLEIEFANAIENAIVRIIEYPKAYAIRYKNIRIAHPKIFPFNIHFYVDDINNSVVLTAIIHNRRKFKIKKRGR